MFNTHFLLPEKLGRWHEIKFILKHYHEEIVSFFDFYRWQDAVEVCYALRISDPPSIERYADKEAMRQLSSPPPKWSLDADEELAKFMSEHVNKQEASLGNISRYVESVQVSSVS